MSKLWPIKIKMKSLEHRKNLTGVENLWDKVAKCEPFWSGKIARFGYSFTAHFGGDSPRGKIA